MLFGDTRVNEALREPFGEFVRPVPSFMAAVIATISSLAAASRTRALPNTFVYLGALEDDFFTSPVARSNGPTPWNTSGRCSAGA